MDLRGIVLLLILTSLSFASNTLADNLNVSLPVILALVIIILAVSSMVGEAFNMPTLLAWVKTEIREMIAGVILFLVVMAILFGTTPVVNILTGETGSSINSDAHNAAEDMITRASDGFGQLIRVYHAVGLATGFTASLSAGYYVGYTMSMSPYAGFGTFMTILGGAAGGLTNTIFIYKSMEVLLDFFGTLGTSLLIFSFAVRFFPFTRQLGNTLIAVVLAATILFPVSLVVINQIHTKIIDMPTLQVPQAVYDKLEIAIPIGANFMCGKLWIRLLVNNFGEIGFALPICLAFATIASLACGIGYAACWPGFFTGCWEITTDIIYPGITQIAIPIAWGVMILADYFKTADIAGAFVAMKPFLVGVNNLAVLTYIDVIIAALITVTGARSISAMLGGEYIIPGIAKLV